MISTGSITGGRACRDPALVRGVTWDPAGPALSLTADDGDTRLPLSAGGWLRFAVAAGPRRCLGYSRVHGPDDTDHTPCPERAAAVRGYQCGPCFARDDFRFMHDFHRSGQAPAGLRAYLAQPHWLYVATFADGATKVGTASARSKWTRLADQGAVVAAYVARARDGRVVRLLEDLVSERAGLTQFVRGTAKFASLLAPRPADDLAGLNAAAAGRVRDLLAAGAPGIEATDGFDVVTEAWARPVLAAAACGPGPRIAYPRPLSEGEHGMRIDSMSGANALVSIDGVASDGAGSDGTGSDGTASDGAGPVFLAGLGDLRGRVIRFGDFVTPVPAFQESLF
ncbi:DUF2797 domain-containing protein [Specibacter cremeus]|uniref:DUF2797 domain-containing protein n=1 Tax=Specibacter cremeus TaxID=1629051 RepID=UPI001F0CC772|nr:DUF2797 domain-containing protein [Specibacter cremeus]